MFIIVGLRLLVVIMFGVDILYMDEWDYFAQSILVPHFNGELEFGNFFEKHNEHYIVFTKAIHYVFFLLSDETITAFSVLLFQCIFPAFVALPFLLSIAKREHSKHLRFVITLALGLPISVENLFWSVGSLWHIANLAVVWAMYIACQKKPAVLRLCILFAIGYFAMAGSIIVAFIVGCVYTFHFLSSRSKIYLLGSFLFFMLFFAALNLTGQIDDSLKPKTVTDFSKSLIYSLGNPYYLGLVFLWPNLVYFILQKYKLKTSISVQELLPISIYLFIGAQSLAIAYARGAEGLGVGNRHLDMFVLLYVGAAFLVLSNVFSSKYRKAYLSLIITLIIVDSMAHLHKLEKIKTSRTRQKKNICMIIQSKKAQETSKANIDLPYISQERMYSWLKNEKLAVSIDCSDALVLRSPN